MTTVRGCEKDWEAVQTALQRDNAANAKVRELLLSKQTGTLATLSESDQAITIATRTGEELKKALTAFAECANLHQTPN